LKYAEAMAQSRRYTAKYRHYAELYDLLLASLPPNPTVLEIGIANGGGLHTWRTLLGDHARIIGVDLNPNSVAMRDEGFEVYVLDTGDPGAWTTLREQVGRSVDLLVDDGGHTNRQQILAVLEGISLVQDGGWLVVEDLHASFMREFGNPSPHSAASFLNRLAADLHRLHPRSESHPRTPALARSVEYMISATSWTAIRVNRSPPSTDELTAGDDQSLMDYDHRWDAPARHGIGRSLLPPRVVSNRYTRSLGAWVDNRLFRRDADG